MEELNFSGEWGEMAERFRISPYLFSVSFYIYETAIIYGIKLSSVSAGHRTSSGIAFVV